MKRLAICKSVLLAAAVAAAAGMSGCFTSRSGAKERTGVVAAAPAESWPARDRVVVEKLRLATPEVIPEYELAPGQTLEGQSPEAKKLLALPERRVTYCQLCKQETGTGLLRVYEKPKREPVASKSREQSDLDKLWKSLSGGFEYNAAFITSRDLTAARWEEWQAEQQVFLEQRRKMGSGPVTSVTPSGKASEIGIEEGIEIEIPAVDEAKSGKYRGVVFHFTTLFPNEYERAVVDRLKQDGWFVVCFDTKVSPIMPRDAAAVAELPGINAQIKAIEDKNREYSDALFGIDGKPRPTEAEKAAQAARWKELGLLMTRASDIKRGWFTVKEASDVPEAGERAAAAVDDLVADNAYAAEAVLSYLGEERKDVPRGPLAIVGMSAGALAAPGVAARLGDRVNAVVLVGGGADLFQISRTSDLKKTGIQFRQDEKTQIPESLAPALHEAYLAHTKLDPYVVAPLLADTPLLTVIAEKDTIVPTANGELLYERLGKPDRMNFSLGHYEMFYFLPKQAGAISRWLEKHVPAAAGSKS